MSREPDIVLLERWAEGSLLLFAALVPVSVAASQICLAVLLLSWLALLAFGAPGWRPRPGLAEIGILCVFAGGAIACLVNRVPGQLAEVLDNHAVLLAFPALVVIARDRPIFYRRAVILAATVGALVGIYGVWQHFAGLDLVRERVLEARGDVFIVKGTFGHHLTYGGSVMLALMSGLALAYSGTRVRFLPSLLLLPLALSLVWSYARSAWLGGFAGTTALFVIGAVGGTLRRLPLVAALLLLVVAGFIIGDSSVRGHVANTVALVHDPPPRVRIWRSTLAMLAEHPLGIGPGRFAALFPTYQVPGEYDSTVHAHADILRALTDAGPVGLVGYLVLVPGSACLAFRALRRRQRGDRTPEDGARTPEDGATAVAGPRRSAALHRVAAERDLLAVALAASTAFCVAGLLQTYFWDLEDLMFWLLLAVPAFAGPAPSDSRA